MESEEGFIKSDQIEQPKDKIFETQILALNNPENPKELVLNLHEFNTNPQNTEQGAKFEVRVEVFGDNIDVKVEVKESKAKNSPEKCKIITNPEETPGHPHSTHKDDLLSRNKYTVLIEVLEKINEKGEEIIDVQVSIKNKEKDVFSSHIEAKAPEDLKETTSEALKQSTSEDLKEKTSEDLKDSEVLKDTEDPKDSEDPSLTSESLQSSILDPDTKPQDFHYEEVQPIECLKSQDSKGNTLVNQYLQIKTLGRGSSAKVKLLSLNNSFYAGKIFTKSFLSNKNDYIETDTGELIMTNALTDFYREIAIMKKLKHPNILSLKEVIYDVSTDKFYLIMDYCQKGAVMEWDEDSEAFYFPWGKDCDVNKTLHQICKGAVQGLYYLHYHNIAHRDIKPQNLLLSEDMTVKLADFGQSHIISDTLMARRTLGTCTFYPPECCGDELDFDPKPCDVWALGLTFYALLYKKMPFESFNEYKVFENILNFQLDFPETQGVDERLKDLIKSMLEKDPGKRITVEGMKVHPYIKQDEDVEVINEDRISVSEEEILKAVSRVGSIFSAVFDI